MKRSLNVPGSLSSALQTMNFSGPAPGEPVATSIRWGILLRPSPRRPDAFSVSKAAAQSRVCTRLLNGLVLIARAIGIGRAGHAAMRLRHLGAAHVRQQRRRPSSQSEAARVPCKYVR